MLIPGFHWQPKHFIIAINIYVILIPIPKTAIHALEFVFYYPDQQDLPLGSLLYFLQARAQYLTLSFFYKCHL